MEVLLVFIQPVLTDGTGFKLCFCRAPTVYPNRKEQSSCRSPGGNGRPFGWSLLLLLLHPAGVQTGRTIKKGQNLRR